MRRILLTIFIAALFFNSHATHIVGGTLSYSCSGNNNYSFTLQLYRDCFQPAQFPPFVHITVYDTASNVIAVLRHNSLFTANIPNNPLNVCPGSTAPNVCVNRGTYSFPSLNLPPIPGGYLVVHQLCCRNGSIISLSNPTTQGMTISAHIPENNVAVCNRSPVFSSFPPTRICVNVPFTFSLSATDADGDSLVYELCTPLQGASPQTAAPDTSAPPPYFDVVYVPPFSGTYPILSQPAFTINPQTGVLTGVPTTIGQYLLGVCISEYRNGALINTSSLDFQFNVFSCNIVVSAVAYQNCIDNTVSFQSLGAAVNYFWEFGDGNTSTDRNPLHAYASSGTYSVSLRVDNGAGCSDSTAQIIEVAPANVNAQFAVTQPVCTGQPVTFTDQSTTTNGTFSQWNWDFGDGTTSTQQNPVKIFSNTGTQTIQLISITNGGCIDTVQQSITIQPAPQVTITPSNPSVCAGGSVQLNASATTGSGFVFAWSPAVGLNDTSVFNPVSSTLNSTAYTVTVTNNDGCAATQTVTVNVGSTISPNVGADKQICIGESSQLNASGGVGYSWTPSLGLDNPNIPNPVASPAQTTEYIVTVEDGSCIGRDTITVFVDTIPFVNAGADATVCAGEPVQLNATGTGIFSWSPATGLNNPDIFNPLATPLTTTTYTVTIQNGACTNSDSVLITVIPLPSANAGNNVSVCEGDTAILSGSGSGTLSWSPAIFLSDNTIPNPSAFPNVTTTFVLEVTEGQCIAVDSVTVFVNAYPEIILTSATETVCAGASVQLNAGGGAAFSWLPATGLNNAQIPDPVATPSESILYVVTVSNGDCVDTASVFITVHPLLEGSAGEDVVICFGEEVTLNAVGGETYAWSSDATLNNANIQNPEASPLQTTIYTVIITDENGCSVSDAVQVTVHEVNVIVSPDTSVIEGGSVQLSAEGGFFFQWSPTESLDDANSAQPVAAPLETTTYSVTATDEAGCTAVATLTITVDAKGEYAIPSAFSPNGDQMNDLFYVITDGVTVEEFKIFNRWGQLVHDDPDSPWDGTYKGEPQPTEIYLYYAVIKKQDGSLIKENGQVKLIR